MSLEPSLIEIRPRAGTICLSRGRTVLVTREDGWIDSEPEHGLFVDETRLVSRHRILVDGKAPTPVTVSPVRQHSSLGYYALLPPHETSESPGGGSGTQETYTQQTLELRVSRLVGNGMHEDVDLVNWSQRRTRLELSVVVDGDFLDSVETHEGRKQHGELTRRWRVDGEPELVLDYRAQHAYEHQGDRGVATIHRVLAVRVGRAGSPARSEGERIVFDVELGPGGRWHCCLVFAPTIDGHRREPLYGCYDFDGHGTEPDRWRRAYEARATRITTHRTTKLGARAAEILERAREDLADLVIFEQGGSADGWVPAAGLPMYVALFGRDTLVTSWQSMLVSPVIARGTIAELPKWQGDRLDAWRDEQPGRMLHEAHTGPLEVLQFNPRQRYYGSVSTSVFYPRALVELWRWTGDREAVARYVEPAMRSLEWVDRYGDIDHDGIYEYRTLSEQGIKNQDWKDSDDAFVDEDGHVVADPIAAVEEQAFVYEAKVGMAELLTWLGDERAPRLLAEAQALKKRFEERFWMEDRLTYAMGLGPEKRPIRTIASNPGLCLAAGIVDRDRARVVADRLMSEHMYSGWGVRTLSATNPAFDPFSYHRGSVWPAEQAALAAAFWRYGLFAHLHRLATGLFEAASLCDQYRLPEVFSGHARDAQHPYPSLYPRTNCPQAWSASCLFMVMQALTGIYPYAPLHLLFLDPHLPAWLPEVEVRDLHVGRATVSLRMWRTASGESRYEVTRRDGALHVVRQPSPWSVSAGRGERARDLLKSIAKEARAP